MKKANTWIFIVFIGFLAVWFIHISFLLSPNVLHQIAGKYSYLKKINTFLQRGIILVIFVLCLVLFVGKRLLDSKWQQYKIYRICATFIVNAVFIFVWLFSLFSNMFFHCDYFWAFHCLEVPCEFPIEIGIGYLFFALPLLCMLILILIFAFYNKILSRNNCLWLSWLVFFMFTFIIIYFFNDGINCQS